MRRKHLGVLAILAVVAMVAAATLAPIAVGANAVAFSGSVNFGGCCGGNVTIDYTAVGCVDLELYVSDVSDGYEDDTFEIRVDGCVVATLPPWTGSMTGNVSLAAGEHEIVFIHTDSVDSPPTEMSYMVTEHPYTGMYTNACTTPCELTVPLCAGQTMDVGNVTASFDASGNVTVRYQTTGDWVLTETHLDVQGNQTDHPMTKKGNPKVGHFGNQTDHGAGVTDFTYYVDISGLDNPDGVFAIAAHAVVYDPVAQQEETAWGDGCEGLGFPWNNWATYFLYPAQ
jgi:hypothetical protein